MVFDLRIRHDRAGYEARVANEPDGPRRPLITWSQLAAAGVATACAAVAASFLGVYGTVIGAALMSVISTGGTVLIQRGLNRTQDRVRTAVTTQLHVRAEPAPEPDPEPDDDLEDGTEKKPRLPRWAIWVLSAVAVFAVVMGIVTVIELALREPLSSAVRGESGTGTTFDRPIERTSTPTPGGSTVPGRTASPSPSSTRTDRGGGNERRASSSSSPKPSTSTSAPEPSTSGNASAEPGAAG